MYTSYVGQSVNFLIYVIFCLCYAKCDISQKNCTVYQQILKENLKKCLVDVTNDNLSSEDSHRTGARRIFIHNKKIVNRTNENLNNYTDDIIPTKSIPEQYNFEVKNKTVWKLPLTEKLDIFIRHIDNESLVINLKQPSADVEARKRKTSLQDVIPYLIIPGFIMAGVVPWLIPGLKLAVMAVGMVNQMAFTSSLFTLIRGYIFDTSQEEHLVYINNGYNKYKNLRKPHKHR